MRPAGDAGPGGGVEEDGQFPCAAISSSFFSVELSRNAMCIKQLPHSAKRSFHFNVLICPIGS